MHGRTGRMSPLSRRDAGNAGRNAARYTDVDAVNWEHDLDDVRGASRPRVCVFHPLVIKAWAL